MSGPGRIGCLVLSACFSFCACSHSSVAEYVAQLEFQLAMKQYGQVLAGLEPLLSPAEEPSLGRRMAKLRLVANAGLGRAEETLAAVESYEQITREAAPLELYGRVIGLLARSEERTDDLIARARRTYPNDVTTLVQTAETAAPQDFVPCPLGHGRECTIEGIQCYTANGCEFIWTHEDPDWRPGSSRNDQQGEKANAR
ncbi:MAG: hypothetical protein ACT4PU_11540 [Planctomycetota bacterium]